MYFCAHRLRRQRRGPILVRSVDVGGVIVSSTVERAVSRRGIVAHVVRSRGDGVLQVRKQGVCNPIEQQNINRY